MCRNKEQNPVECDRKTREKIDMHMEACVVLAQEIAREIFTIRMSRSYVGILYWAILPCQFKGEIDTW